jgi:hypothetical protein
MDLDQRPIGYNKRAAEHQLRTQFRSKLERYFFVADFSGGAMYSWNQNWEQRWAYQNDGALNKYISSTDGTAPIRSI